MGLEVVVVLVTVDDPALLPARIPALIPGLDGPLPLPNSGFGTVDIVDVDLV